MTELIGLADALKLARAYHHWRLHTLDWLRHTQGAAMITEGDSP